MNIFSITINRLKNIWAWSGYHPTKDLDKIPEDVNVGFSWTGNKKAQIIKRHNDPAGEIVGNLKNKMEKKVQPFGNNILVKPSEVKHSLVNQEKSLCEFGLVLAVGDEVKKIKVGQTIGYTVFGINSLSVDNDKFYFVPETSEFILGIFEN